MAVVKIDFRGIEFDVEYTWHPEEIQRMYWPDGSGTPGSPAYVDIDDIKHEGVSFYDLFCGKMDEIETLVFEKIG